MLLFLISINLKHIMNIIIDKEARKKELLLLIEKKKEEMNELKAPY